jgi:hypothetical protein
MRLVCELIRKLSSLNTTRLYGSCLDNGSSSLLFQNLTTYLSNIQNHLSSNQTRVSKKLLDSNQFQLLEKNLVHNSILLNKFNHNHPSAIDHLSNLNDRLNGTFVLNNNSHTNTTNTNNTNVGSAANEAIFIIVVICFYSLSIAFLVLFNVKFKIVLVKKPGESFYRVHTQPNNDLYEMQKEETKTTIEMLFKDTSRVLTSVALSSAELFQTSTTIENKNSNNNSKAALILENKNKNSKSKNLTELMTMINKNDVQDQQQDDEMKIELKASLV